MIKPVQIARRLALFSGVVLLNLPATWAADKQAKEEHGAIGVDESTQRSESTRHPDAQWFPDAGFGLFLHWGISTVQPLNDVSWPMIPGRALGNKRIDDPAERQRIVQSGDWNLNGKPPIITPNNYWAVAKDFNPQKYDPDKWLAAAKQAGFTYAVLITRHHEGFSFWPSDADQFNTKLHLQGRDFVKPFVDACRKHGLKVGLYYSPPNWHFNREFENFLYYGAARKNPEFPALDGDLKPRTQKPSAEAQAQQTAAYAKMVRLQVEELLTRYGKVDLLWFDGAVPGIKGDQVITLERIRELQPGIVVNPRLHGRGDFKTFEGHMEIAKPVSGWAEFCHTWAASWTYTQLPFRSDAFILGNLVRSRSLGVNYLLGTGPDRHGELDSAAYTRMASVADWMKKNGEAIYTVRPLAKGESASVPASALKTVRYLYHIPAFKAKYNYRGPYDSDLLPPVDTTLEFRGAQVKSVTLLEDGQPLDFKVEAGVVKITLPVARQSKRVDVVKLELAGLN
jgi:alpha-L-fucosidase